MTGVQTCALPISNDILGDMFIAKIDPSGANLIYSVLLGPGKPSAIIVDLNGAVYVAGSDSGRGFPTTQGAALTDGRLFLLKLDNSGSRLIYSTKLGGTFGELSSSSLTVDASGNAFVAGYSQNVLTTQRAYKPTGFGPFALKMNSQGTALIYSTYLPSAPAHASARRGQTQLVYRPFAL